MWYLLFIKPFSNIAKSIARAAGQVLMAMLTMMFVIFVLLLVALFTMGAPIIAVYAIVQLVQQKISWPYILMALALNVVGFYCLTSNDLKAYPFLFRLTFWGNYLAFIPMLAYLIVLQFYKKLIHNSFTIFIVVTLLGISVYSIYVFDKKYKAAQLATCKQGSFNIVYRQQKRAYYADRYNALIQSHPTIYMRDYKRFNIESGRNLFVFNNNKNFSEILDKNLSTDSLILMRFGSSVGLIKYSYGSGYYAGFTPLFQQSYSYGKGWDVLYVDGQLLFDPRRDTTDKSTIEYALWRGEKVYRQVVFRVDVISKNIDSYIDYAESNRVSPTGHSSTLYLSEEFLKTRGIAIKPREMEHSIIDDEIE